MEVNYHDGDFLSSTRYELCRVDTVGNPGNWFLNRASRK